jgi:hypothetical protein
MPQRIEQRRGSAVEDCDKEQVWALSCFFL